MTRVLSFPHVGNLQVHSTTPRLDLTHLRHKVHAKNVTTYKFKAPNVYHCVEDSFEGEVESDYALVRAIDFFRERMWLPPSTCIRVEARRELIASNPLQQSQLQSHLSRSFEDASKVGILIVSQKNILGGYYTFTSSKQSQCKSHESHERDIGGIEHIRTNLAPGQMVFFEQDNDRRIECTVSPMITIDHCKVGIRNTLVFTVTM